MSKENVIEFEEMILNTPALQEEVQALGDSLEAIVALGRQNNYDFSFIKVFDATLVLDAGVALRIGITGNTLIRMVIINRNQAKEEKVIAHSSTVG